MPPKKTKKKRRPPEVPAPLELPTPTHVARNAPESSFTFMDAFPKPGVVIILGFQGSGKTSLAYWIMDQYHKKRGLAGAVYQPPMSLMQMLPEWVQPVGNILEFPEDAVCVVDEADRALHARRSASTLNMDFSRLSGLARQRNQIILFITHTSRKIDLLEISDAKRIVYKRPSGGQVMLDRREVKPFTARALRAFDEAKGDSRKKAYIVDLERLRFGMVQVRQAPWWTEGMSTAMKDLETPLEGGDDGPLTGHQ